MSAREADTPLREAAWRLAVAHHRHGQIQPEYHGERYAREMQERLLGALAEAEAAAVAHFGSNAWLYAGDEAGQEQIEREAERARAGAAA